MWDQNEEDVFKKWEESAQCARLRPITDQKITWYMIRIEAIRISNGNTKKVHHLFRYDGISDVCYIIFLSIHFASLTWRHNAKDKDIIMFSGMDTVHPFTMNPPRG